MSMVDMGALALLEGAPDPASAPALALLRVAGANRFRSVGLPGNHDEAWRFTNVDILKKIAFQPALPGLEKPSRDGGLNIADEALALIGQYGRVDAMSTRLPKGLAVLSIADAAADTSWLGSIASMDVHPFAALNAAWVKDGMSLTADVGFHATGPLVLDNVLTGGSVPSMSHPRHLIHLKEGSELTLVEDYRSSGGTHFVNPVMEIRLAKNSRLRHVVVIREGAGGIHVGNIAVSQGAGSDYQSTLLVVGGRLVRNDISSRLEGEGATCTMNGLYVGQGEALIDTHTLLDHRAPGCRSRETYHGLLSDRAHGVFNGRVVVGRGAQRSDSAQSCRTLMLSDHAVIDAKPQLEILADDVKCSHGATVGCLDEDSLHYLRTRGISADLARQMLTMGFARQILEAMDLPSVRDALEPVTEAALV